MTFNVPSLMEQAAFWGLVWFLARRGFQLVEILIKAVLLVYRQSGQELPEWFANQYKEINGNATATRQEKHDLLGPKNDSSVHDIRANIKGAGR